MAGTSPASIAHQYECPASVRHLPSAIIQIRTEWKLGTSHHHLVGAMLPGATEVPRDEEVIHPVAFDDVRTLDRCRCRCTTTSDRNGFRL